ncbi:unnamed protein product, partial [Discosporangium mesarthrocarpum]
GLLGKAESSGRLPLVLSSDQRGGLVMMGGEAREQDDVPLSNVVGVGAFSCQDTKIKPTEGHSRLSITTTNTGPLGAAGRREGRDGTR